MPNQRAPGARSGPWRLLLLVLVLAVIGVGTGLAVSRMGTSSRGGGSTVPSRPPATVAPPAGGPPAGALRVVGNQVLDCHGAPVHPVRLRGVVPVEPGPELRRPPSSSNPNTDADKIRAAASFWHANVVRIQVAWQHLFPAGDTDTVDPVVPGAAGQRGPLANSLHMVAIITLQTERYQGSMMPDAQAVAFWTEMARHYAGIPRWSSSTSSTSPGSPPSTGPNGARRACGRSGRLGGTVTLDRRRIADHVRGYAAVGRHRSRQRGGQRRRRRREPVRPRPVRASRPRLSGNDIAYGMEPDIGRGVTFPFGGSSAGAPGTRTGRRSRRPIP